MKLSRRHWFRWAGMGALAPLTLLTQRVFGQDHSAHQLPSAATAAPAPAHAAAAAAPTPPRDHRYQPVRP